MPSLHRLLFAFVLLAASSTGVGLAQNPNPLTPAAVLDQASAQLEAAQKQMGSLAPDADDSQLADLRDKALQAQSMAEDVIARQTPRLDGVQARLTELGAAPEAGAVNEASDVRTLRSNLNREQAELDGDIKRARLISLSAQQLTDSVADRRRARFREHLWQRTSSPLAPDFWIDIAHNFPRDLRRLAGLRHELQDGLRSTLAPANLPRALGGFVVAVLLITLGRRWAETLLIRLMTRRLPPGRLRRSVAAFAILLPSTLAPGLAAHALYIGASSLTPLPDQADALARVLVALIYFGAFINGLGRALLMRRRPSWRLAPIPDAVVARLRPLPLLLGTTATLGLLIEQVNSLVGASLTAAVTTSCVIALANSLVMMALLIRLRRWQPATEDAEAPPRAERPAWLSALIGAAWLSVWTALFGVLSGYIAFASFISKQMMWIGIVAATLYLLVHLIDDFFTTLLSSREADSDTPRTNWGLNPQLVDQSGVLLSGLVRAAVFAVALVAVLVPFGANPETLFGQLSGLAAGVKIGELLLSPGAVFTALAVLVLGMAAVRVVQRWFSDQYLPKTSLDTGLGNSFSTMLGYLGGIVVISLTLSTLGLSVERIAWVASALSVGIGFGLQAIVQNFISGLILLAERPVKVGDWVVLGDAEGDIRRIRVRATEIQLADRSTMIVPNSEFITKSVRNMTLARPEGRVLIKLPMPLDTDANAVRELLLQICAEHSAVLRNPAPLVMLDGIEGSAMILVLVAFVSGPRQAGGVRSELLFTILARLRQAQIPLSNAPTVVMRREPAALAPRPENQTAEAAPKA